MAPLEDRVAHAREVARHPRIAVSALEAGLGTRFTIDTLRLLRQRFPAARFVWLMGADNFQQFPRWREWTHIFQQAPIAVFRRKDYAIGGAAAIRFARARHPASFAPRLADAPPPAWLVLDNPLNLLSATAIRRRTK
jgi:nicotinate-nucleotide adenylyltransferase